MMPSHSGLARAFCVRRRCAVSCVVFLYTTSCYARHPTTINNQVCMFVCMYVSI